MAKNLLYLVVLSLAVYGCTLTRFAAYKFPNPDHYKKFKYRIVEKSDTPFYFVETPYSPLPPLELWVEEKYSKGFNTVEEFLVESQTTALMVIRNDTIIYENYFNGHYRDKPAIVFSISKAITTTIVGKALEEGYFTGRDQLVSDFIPEFANDGRRTMTIDHLLNMTSGLDFFDTETLWKLARAYYSKNVNDYVKKVKLKYKPGEHFSYKSIDTQILAYCLDLALGDITLQQYLETKLWKPIGSEYDALLTLDKEGGSARMYGGIAACTRDLAKFGKLFLENGKKESEQLIDKEWVDDSKSRKSEDDRHWSYSNGWWLDSYINGELFKKRDFIAAGFQGQIIYVNPDYNMIIVRQGKRRDKIYWTYLISRLASVLQKPDNCRPDEIYVDEVEGKYKNEKGDKVSLKFDGKFWIAEGIELGKIKMVDECPQSLFNSKRRIRIILHKENDIVVGLYVDDFKKVIHYKKV